MRDPLLRIIEKLRKKDVQFLVVGGFAAVLYGVPRATFDLDLLVLPEEGNLKKLLTVFRSMAFRKAVALSKASSKPKVLGSVKGRPFGSPPARGMRPRAGTAPETPGMPGASSAVKELTVKAILKKSAVRFTNSETVDCLFYAGKRLFSLLLKGSREIRVKRVSIPCPNLADLIQLKEWSGRPQDQYDLHCLREILKSSSWVRGRS